MINIAALGLYMLLSGVTGNPGAVQMPVADNTTPILVESPKKESTNEIDKNTEAYVRSYFSDLPILAEVARCESHFRQTDKNGNIIRGIENHFDVGVMQINEKYHLDASKKLGMDIYTLEGNLAYGKYLYSKNGTKDWFASAPCWAGNLSEKESSHSISNS